MLRLPLLLLSLLAANTGFATDNLRLHDAWVRATPPGAAVAGAFVTIENPGSTADRLVSASSTAADSVEIHEMKMDGEMMQMRELSNGLPIPAKQRVALKPGGIHLMLISPKQPFTVGQQVMITLVFEKAGKRTLDFAVLRQAPDADGHAHHAH